MPPMDLPPPLPPPRPRRQRVTWDVSASPASLRGRDDDDLAAAYENEATEDEWNQRCFAVANAPLHLEKVRSEKRAKFALKVGMQTSLWNAKATRQSDGSSPPGSASSSSSSPSSVTELVYQNVPIQLLIWDIVRARKVKKNPGSDPKRHTVGMTKPDLLTFMRANGPQQLNPDKHYVISSVSEFKVTRLEWKNAKRVVAIDKDADQDLMEWLDDEHLSHQSYSAVSDNGDREHTIVRLDTQAKWVAGTAKALVYLESIHQFCGGYLGTVVIGTRFARLARLADYIVIECADDFLQQHAQPETLRQFLGIKDRFARLPWELARVAAAEASDADAEQGDVLWNGWSEGADVPNGALAVLLDYTKLSAEILSHHTAEGPPFGRLAEPPQSELPTLVTTLDAIESSARAFEPTRDNHTVAIEEGMATKATPVPRPPTPKKVPGARSKRSRDDDNDDGRGGGAGGSRTGDGDDDGDDVGGPGGDDAGGGAVDKTPRRSARLSTRQATANPPVTHTHRTLPPSPSTESSPIRRWRANVPSHSPTLTPPISPPKDCATTPSSTSQPLTEASLMQHDAHDGIDFDPSDDEDLEWTVEGPPQTLVRVDDLLQAIDEHGMRTILVSKDQMSAIVAEVRTWLAAGADE